MKYTKFLYLLQKIPITIECKKISSFLRILSGRPYAPTPLKISKKSLGLGTCTYNWQYCLPVVLLGVHEGMQDGPCSSLGRQSRY